MRSIPVLATTAQEKLEDIPSGAEKGALVGSILTVPTVTVQVIVIRTIAEEVRIT